MSDTIWTLKGVDPDTRAHALAEAERRGISLSDFLTEVLLRGAPLEAPQSIDSVAFDEEFGPPPEAGVNFAVRHRLEALERRLGLAVGSLDGSMAALDKSFFTMAARLDETGALANDTAHQLDLALQDVTGSLAALRKRLGDAEDGLEDLSEHGDLAHADLAERCTVLEQRLIHVSGVARGAEAAGAALGAAHEALQRALAQDVNALAENTAERIDVAVEDMRLIAEDAARHADEAVARAIDTLRATREQIERNVADTAAETLTHVHGSFADAAERLGALAERVIENECAVARTRDHLTARMIDVEDGALTALEETAETLRHADAVLTSELTRLGHEARTAIAASHEDLASAVGEIGERQADSSVRITLIDAAIGNLVNDVDALETRVIHQDQAWDQRFTVQDAGFVRELAALRTRIAEGAEAARARLAESQAEVEERFTAWGRTFVTHERETAEKTHAIEAEIARVEACTLASLGKLSRDIIDSDARVQQQLGVEIDAARGEIDVIRSEIDGARGEIGAARGEIDIVRSEIGGARAEIGVVRGEIGAARGEIDGARGDITDMRDHHAGVLARLNLLDRGLGALENGAVSASERLAQLEYAARNAQTDQALAVLHTEVRTLGDQLAEMRAGDTDQKLALLHARIETLAGHLAKVRSIDAEHRFVAVEARVETLAHDTEQALSDVQHEVGALAGQVAQLRAADMPAALTTLAAHVETLASQQRGETGLAQRLDDLRARLAAQEAQGGESVERVHALTRMLGRVTSQHADIATQTEDRLHKLELALTDARLDAATSADYAQVELHGKLQDELQGRVQEIAARIADMERRQAGAFETLRAEIASFAGDNDGRLTALERGGVATLTADEQLIAHAVESRLTTLEQRDVSGSFEALRQRVEDRILSVETRSVRALEQVSETVALIEKRMHQSTDAESAARSA